MIDVSDGELRELTDDYVNGFPAGAQLHPRCSLLLRSGKQ